MSVDTYALTPDQRLFLLAHLFGHTVQWNVDPSAFSMGQPKIPVTEEELRPLLDYELQAASYGLALLHEVGAADVDQWFSDYSASDQAYLSHFYRTGEKGEFQSFWKAGAPLLAPRTPPAFTPSKHPSRLDGVVI